MNEVELQFCHHSYKEMFRDKNDFHNYLLSLEDELNTRFFLERRVQEEEIWTKTMLPKYGRKCVVIPNDRGDTYLCMDCLIELMLLLPKD